jgi:ubiquinone/menaquinone biosynthesis C-methylase UbiE
MRIIHSEKLESATAEEAAANLADLRRINRYLGGHATLLAALRRLYRPGDSFSVLDLGAASGDMGQALQRRYPAARVLSVDTQERHLREGGGARLVGDAFRLPIGDQRVDVVMCSLFLHHFTDAEVTVLLRNMQRVARRAVVVLDLERHALARAFLPATRWLFQWHPVTVHDGPVSVQAGFLPRELRALAESAGLRNASVRRHVPWFRLSLVWEKPKANGILT